MLVKDRMTANPVTITKQTTVATALELMQTNNFRRLPVMDGDKLIGIVTDRDLSKLSPSPATTLSVFEANYLLAKTTIAEALSKNHKLITISPEAYIEEAALLMRDNNIGGIPVVDEGKLVGIITETNIFDAFVDIMGLRQSGYRITVIIESDRSGVLAELADAITSNEGNITHVLTYYGTSDEVHIVFRLNQGNIEHIMATITELGYKAEYTETNQ